VEVLFSPRVSPNITKDQLAALEGSRMGVAANETVEQRGQGFAVQLRLPHPGDAAVGSPLNRSGLRGTDCPGLVRVNGADAHGVSL